MSTKKFNHEVEKVMKECRQQMEFFDDKWRQLRSLCAEAAVIQSISPEAGGSGIKAKKKVGNRPQCLESMDQRYVQDSIGKLKTELEVAHKKLYKFRNEMDRLAASPELKNSGRAAHIFMDMKREIESRSKKGKTFYLDGVSSDIQDVNDFSSASPVLAWIAIFIGELQQQTEKMNKDIERHQGTEEADILRGMVEVHAIHVMKLNALHRAIENRTISQKGYQYDELEEGYVNQALADAAALARRNKDEDSEDQADLVMEIRQELERYIYENEDYEYIVCEEIYERLPLNLSEEEEEPEPEPESDPLPTPKKAPSKKEAESPKAPAVTRIASSPTSSCSSATTPNPGVLLPKMRTPSASPSSSSFVTVKSTTTSNAVASTVLPVTSASKTSLAASPSAAMTGRSTLIPSGSGHSNVTTSPGCLEGVPLSRWLKGAPQEITKENATTTTATVDPPTIAISPAASSVRATTAELNAAATAAPGPNNHFSSSAPATAVSVTGVSSLPSVKHSVPGALGGTTSPFATATGQPSRPELACVPDTCHPLLDAPNQGPPPKRADDVSFKLVSKYAERLFDRPPWKDWLNDTFFKPNVAQPFPTPTMTEAEISNDEEASTTDFAHKLYYNAQLLDPIMDPLLNRVHGALPKADQRYLGQAYHLLAAAQRLTSMNTRNHGSCQVTDNNGIHFGPQTSSTAVAAGDGPSGTSSLTPTDTEDPFSAFLSNSDSISPLRSDVIGMRRWQPPDAHRVAYRWQALGLCQMTDEILQQWAPMYDELARQDEEGFGQKSLDTKYLAINTGDIIQTAAATEDGWIFGRNRLTKLTGWFPAMVVTPVPSEMLDIYQTFVEVKFKTEAVHEWCLPDTTLSALAPETDYESSLLIEDYSALWLHLHPPRELATNPTTDGLLRTNIGE